MTDLALSTRMKIVGERLRWERLKRRKHKTASYRSAPAGNGYPADACVHSPQQQRLLYVILADNSGERESAVLPVLARRRVRGCHVQVQHATLSEHPIPPACWTHRVFISMLPSYPTFSSCETLIAAPRITKNYEVAPGGDSIRPTSHLGCG